MFIELTNEAWKKLQKKLEEKNITDFTVTDCTLPGDSIPHVHIDFGAGLSKAMIEDLAKDVDGAFEAVANESRPREVRKRKWDEKFHTPGQEAKGWFTGENTQEEVVYE